MILKGRLMPLLTSIPKHIKRGIFSRQNGIEGREIHMDFFVLYGGFFVLYGGFFVLYGVFSPRMGVLSPVCFHPRMDLLQQHSYNVAWYFAFGSVNVNSVPTPNVLTTSMCSS